MFKTCILMLKDWTAHVHKCPSPTLLCSKQQFSAHPRNAHALAPTVANQRTEPKDPEKFADQADTQVY